MMKIDGIEVKNQRKWSIWNFWKRMTIIPIYGSEHKRNKTTWLC